MKTTNTEFDWDVFSVGFWHPFGPHGGETPEQIIQRKSNEIAQNGWTLWSFRSRSADPRKELSHWSEAIKAEGAPKVFALCADSRAGSSTEPISATAPAKEYLSPLEQAWETVPEAIQIPHHFGSNPMACAFKVGAINLLPKSEAQPALGIEWLNSAGIWRNDIFPNGLHYPNRGEYLLRRKSDSQAHLRRVRVVLELDAPYVVAIRK